MTICIKHAACNKSNLIATYPIEYLSIKGIQQDFNCVSFFCPFLPGISIHILFSSIMPISFNFHGRNFMNFSDKQIKNNINKSKTTFFDLAIYKIKQKAGSLNEMMMVTFE